MRHASYLLVALALVACRDDTTALCPEGAVCAIACTMDADCDTGFECNDTGRCQRREPCSGNADCNEGELCDARLAACVPSETCLYDLHCPFGSKCEAGACVEGCLGTGDCPLGQSCADGRCVDECLSNDYCALGAVCAGGTCYPSPNPSHCAPCSVDRECPFPGTDYCLINQAYSPQAPERGPQRYCGVDCADDPAKCPNGYECKAVVLLTEDPCENDVQCQRLDRQCVIEEGADQGFCSCGTDRDCLPESLPPRCRLGFCEAPAGRLCGDDNDCLPLRVCDRHGGAPFDICVTNGNRCDSSEDCLCEEGRCINTGRPCREGADCKLSCVSGLCFVGASCSPVEGLYCPDLLPQ